MDISGVNTGVNLCNCFSPCTGSTLSDETKRKLRELGIDPSTVSSEAQAIALIEATLKKIAMQVSDTSQNSCNGESDILSRAKTLARKFGIPVVSSNLKQMMKTLEKAANEKKEHQDEFLALKSDYEKIEQSQNSMYLAMNITASLNKFKLGLK